MQLMYLESLTVIMQLNAINVICETHPAHATQLTQFTKLVQVVVTSESARAIDQLRRACGGHGFMASSNLPCRGCVFLLSFAKSSQIHLIAKRTVFTWYGAKIHILALYLWDGNSCLHLWGREHCPDAADCQVAGFSYVHQQVIQRMYSFQVLGESP